MADFPVYLEAPLEGESPYVDVVTPALAGTYEIKIYAGRLEDQQLQHWELVRGLHTLTCTGAANRKISHKLYYDYGQGVEFLAMAIISSNNITDGQTGERVIVPFASVLNCAEYYGNSSETVRGAGPLFMFKGTDYIHCYISGGLAADLHQLAFTFKYLNYDLGTRIKG